MAAYWCCWHDPSLRPSTRARAVRSRRWDWADRAAPLRWDAPTAETVGAAAAHLLGAGVLEARAGRSCSGSVRDSCRGNGGLAAECMGCSERGHEAVCSSWDIRCDANRVGVNSAPGAVPTR